MPRLPSSMAADSPAGPPPMIRTGTAISSTGPSRGEPATRGSSGRPSTGSTRMPGPDELHAGLDRQAVGQDQALGALAVGAENALGGVVLVMIAEGSLAVGEEGGRDRFALLRAEALGLSRVKSMACRGRRSQDGVLVDAVIAHKSLLGPVNGALGIAPTSVRGFP